MIVGVDLCDRMRGVALKLLAFEHLLSEAPQYRSRVLLIQRCLRDTAYNMREGDASKSVSELKVLVDRINDMCKPHKVVDFEIVDAREFDRSRRVALFVDASVYIYTPVRDGKYFEK